MRTRAGGAVLSVALVLQLGLVALLSLTSPASAVTAAEETLPVEVTITEVTPQVLQPGEDLVVTATVANTGDAPLAEPRVLVRIDPRTYISRTSLDRWRDAAPLDNAGTAVLIVDLPGPIGPGQSAEVTATVPSASVGLRSTRTSWGPRGLALEVVDRADPARARQGLARTFALWFPEQEVTETRLSILTPVVGPAVDPHDVAWVGDLEELTRPGGRLAALLDATADHRAVTWVVDPWLVDVTTGTLPPDVPGRTGTSVAAGAVARAWTDDLTGVMTNRDVRLLPYGDADVAALAHAAAPESFDQSLELSREVAAETDLPDSATPSIAWPAGPLPDLVTTGFLSGTPVQAVVVGPGEMRAPEVLTYTATGRTTVATAAGEVTVLVPDDRLSGALLSGFVRSTSDDEAGGGAAEDEAAEEPTGATAAQDLLAELAVITRERPSDSRHLLMTTPRDWSPDAERVSAQLAALDAAPWVSLEPISALVGAPDTGEDRGTLPARSVDPSEIPPAEIDTVRQAVAERTDLAAMVDDPAAFLADAEPETLLPLSVAWRREPTGRSEVVGQSVARTSALRDAVAVDPGRVLNLISTTGGLPVRVSNALDQPVTVVVALRPDDPRLVAEESVTVTIPARGEESVQIPVHALQSADIAVVVELRTPSGVLVDADTVMTVRVRAEWEGIGTVVIGGLLALGLVIGLIRTIRRGRGGQRAAPVDSGPDALSPEEAADRAEHGGASHEPAGRPHR